VTRLLLDPDEQFIVSCAYDNVIKRWRIRDGTHEFDFPSQFGLPRTEVSSDNAVISHDGKSLLINNSLELVICNIETSVVLAIQPFDFRPNVLEPIKLGPTPGCLIVPMSVRGFILWDYLAGDLISRHESFTSHGIDFTGGDDVVFYGYSDNTIEINHERMNDRTCLRQHSDAILNVRHVGPFLFSTSVDRTLKIWDVSSGELVRSHCLNIRNCRPIAVSDSFVATVYDGFQIAIWDVETHELSLVLPGHRQEISYMEWVVPRYLLASASEDMCIRIWDIRQETLLCEFTVEAPITAGIHSPKNGTITIGDGGGRLHFLKLEL
jgi:WD40 repeat protein